MGWEVLEEDLDRARSLWPRSPLKWRGGDRAGSSWRGRWREARGGYLLQQAVAHALPFPPRSRKEPRLQVERSCSCPGRKPRSPTLLCSNEPFSTRTRTPTQREQHPDGRCLPETPPGSQAASPLSPRKETHRVVGPLGERSHAAHGFVASKLPQLLLRCCTAAGAHRETIPQGCNCPSEQRIT